MLVAYFDESGIHDHSKVISVGGLIGQMREWDRLQKPWKKNLAVQKIEWFHAYECEEGVEQFVGLSRPLRESLVNGLSIALCERHLAYVGGALLRDAWDSTPPGLRRGYADSPYAFCVSTAIIRACDFAQAIGKKERAAIVFALPKLADRELALRVHATLSNEDYPGIGSISFSTPQELIQLQAADLIAYESYRYLASRVTQGRGNFTIRPALKRFHESNRPMWLGYFDRESMDGVMRDNPHLAHTDFFLGESRG